MTKEIEKLWAEHFAEECSLIDSEAERALIRRSSELHRAIADALSNTQNGMLEKYVELLYDIQAAFMKKAFLHGCRFAASFLLDALNP